MTDQLDDDLATDLATDLASDSVAQQPAGVVQLDPAATPTKRKRVTRWDRPPDPHDWRYFVGGLGKILITIGLLMFGFVAYQLWGTGIETARAQNQLENEFEQLISANQDTSDTTDVADSVVETPTTVAPDSSQPAPVTTNVPDASGATTPPPSTPDAPPAAAPVTVEQDIPPIERGQPIARLEIPKIGKTDGDALYVVPGVDQEDLKKGPGHYSDTPLPGQLGNASIAGHRTTFGEPFRHIDQLEPGDEIIVTMASGDRFVYQVTSTEIVEASDYYVVTTTDPNVAMLTLTSCHPVYTARQRIAVHSVLVPEQSAPIGVATYYDLEGERDESGNEAVVTQPSNATTPEASIDQTSGNTADAVSIDESVAASADDSGLLPTPVADTGDAFSGGWFHDSDAWPQIALWGAALIAIAFAVSRISRRFRRYSVGIAVGIVPFLICLYFFYQNINRLLPPGL